ncbi:unnamed protein product [Pedinophyceae sp. YPF-701]|nr:unnamed protein product [Pedinophyceae sp. YPF-701]
MKGTPISFSIGKRKNTLALYTQEKKKREEKQKAEADKVFESFVEAFGGPEDEDPAPKRRRRDTAPPRPPPGHHHHTERSPAPTLTPKVARHAPPPEPPQTAPAPMAKRSKKGGSRVLDEMLQELKQNQQRREERRAMGLDDAEDFATLSSGDPATTNLHISNLAPDVDEGILLREFGHYGPIASVKVMWPRCEEEVRRGRNTAFVAFMRREDAEKALEGLNGCRLHDMAIMLGWSKAITIPRAPVWPAPGSGAAAQPLYRPHKADIRTAPTTTAEINLQAILDEGGREVKLPADPRVRYLADTAAAFVLELGPVFEHMLAQEHKDEPAYQFLTDLASEDHAYYRWRLYSLAQGDTLSRWRVEPFEFIEDSPRWLPPTMTAHKVVKDRPEADATLPAADAARIRAALDDLLPAPDRELIGDVTMLCLDSAAHAKDVAALLLGALADASARAPARVARLLAVSDVLHNAHATRSDQTAALRRALEDGLPDAFESLAKCYRASGPRGARALGRYVADVLGAWQHSMVIPAELLRGLHATFACAVYDLPKHLVDDADQRLRPGLVEIGEDGAVARCRRLGLPRSGGFEAMVSRIVAADAFQRAAESGAKLPHAATTGRDDDDGAQVPALAGGAQGLPGVEDAVAKAKAAAAERARAATQRRSGTMTMQERADAAVLASKWADSDDEDGDERRGVGRGRDGGAKARQGEAPTVADVLATAAHALREAQAAAVEGRTAGPPPAEAAETLRAELVAAGVEEAEAREHSRRHRRKLEDFEDEARRCPERARARYGSGDDRDAGRDAHDRRGRHDEHRYYEERR